MGELPGLGVLLGHILEAELLRLEEGILFVEGGVVEQLAGRHPQGVGDGLDDVGGGVLAALLDVAQVALGDPGLVGQGLQGEVPVCAKPADGQSYVVSESPLRHCLTPEFESCPAAAEQTVRSAVYGVACENATTRHTQRRAG